MVIALVPMMTMLPALLLRGRQNVLDHELADQWNPRAKIEGAWLRRPVRVALATALLLAPQRRSNDVDETRPI